MSSLNKLFTPNLCKLLIFIVSFTFLNLFAVLQPSYLLRIEIKSDGENAVNGLSSLSDSNLSAEQKLFIEFGAIRRAASEIITVNANDNTVNRKINFLETATNFFEERLQRLLKTGKKFPKAYENFVDVKNSFDALKTNVDKTSKEGDELFEKHLRTYLTSVGNWLEKISKTYHLNMKTESEECANKMKILEKKISRQINEVQHGELCKNSTRTFELWEAAAQFFSSRIVNMMFTMIEKTFFKYKHSHVSFLRHKTTIKVGSHCFKSNL